MANFTNTSIEEIFLFLKQTATEIYPDKDWAGLREGSFEWLLARMVASVSSQLSTNANFRSREAYISTAETLKDLRDLAKNIGFVIQERTGATTTISVTASNDVTIPKGASCSSSAGLTFSTLSELSLSSGTSLTGSVQVVHGDFQNIETRSFGNPNEFISLNIDDVLVDNLSVSVNGVVWERANNLQNAGSDSKIYRIDFDDSQRVVLVFGDGVYGERLPADALVSIDVYSGGGAAGNSVAAGTITSIRGSFANSSRIYTVTNPVAASGGQVSDSVDSIRARIPIALKNISGLLNAEDIPQVIKNNLSWVSDATADQGFLQTADGITIPAISVTAFPIASDVQDMNSSQLSELNTFLANRGLVGTQYDGYNASKAPVELELEVKLSNRNLVDQKRTEITNVLLNNSESIFNFNQLSFDRKIFADDIVDAAESVDGVRLAKINRFARIPQTHSHIGSDTSSFVDIELGGGADDGYVVFSADVSTTSGSTLFLKPFSADFIGSDFITDNSKNWLAESHSFDSSNDLDDTDGPYIKVNGSSKLEFKQLTRVWKSDQWNASYYGGKYLVKVTWVDASNNPQEAYYHIADTTAPDTIITTENASSPISGTAITTLASASVSNINVDIIEDQTDGGVGYFSTKNNNGFGITHNNENTIYSGSTLIGNVPAGKDVFITFNDTAFDITSGSWISESDILRVRFDDTGALASGDVAYIYTTPVSANNISFKHPREVFTLDPSNLTIRFV